MAKQELSGQLYALADQLRTQEAELAQMRAIVGNPPRSIGKVGEAIRQARQAQGLTQSDLKDLADIGITTVVNIENGQTTVRLDTLQKLTGALGLRLYVGD